MITAQTTIYQVRQHFRHLGIEMPSKLEAAFTAIDESSLHFDPANASGVLEAALAARADGRDPATDEGVRAALTRMLLVHHSGAITAAQESMQEKARREALVDHGPALVEAMRPVVEAAERTIAHARDVLGTDSLRLDDPTMVGSLDSTRLAPWATARESLLRVERVEEVWVFLAYATRLADVAPNDQALIVADTDDIGLVSRMSRGFGVTHSTSSARAVVEAGLTLSLATFEQYKQRVAACRQTEQERETQMPRHPFAAAPRTGMRVPLG